MTIYQFAFQYIWPLWLLLTGFLVGYGVGHRYGRRRARRRQ